ncbi:metal ABC transporter solute-binding protein, Zn/Mn family [Amphibiibacter pelophylacis]|uniref:Zinc ABC transporter substrate-binding protein n=1 Tax=Amphibiibacter pelophylacis TaxID=1799477 RepID=A0ACC6P1J0_9BURK
MSVLQSVSRRRALLALSALPLLAHGGLALAQSTPASGPLQVLTSTTILRDWVQQVGGDAVAVQSLIGPDSDPHVFEPSPRDAQRVAQAQVLVLNGLGLEGWQQRLITSSHFQGHLIIASQGVKALDGFEEAESHDDSDHAHDHGGKDPHYWQDPRQAMIAVRNITAGLSAARPQQAAAFKARAATYLAQLEKLDQAIRARFNAIPAAQRRIVTSHDAFGYFGHNYGLSLIPLTGWTSASAASAKTVARAVTQLRQRRARALFLENISDPRLIDQIARESGVRVGGTLYSDALSAPGSAADSYLKMVASNASTLLAALETTPQPPIQP